MLKKKYRLTKAKDIKVTSVRGQAFFNAYFTLKFSPASLPTPLCTVVVSTKISTKAVERNRIKRVVREVLRDRLAELRTGMYVVYAKPKAAGQENKLLRERFSELLNTLIK